MNDTKNYLIIGGNSGIGKSLANLLISKNHSVTLASRKGSLVTSIKSLVYDATQDELKSEDLPAQLDGLVYCPGSINLKPFHRLTDQEFLDDFNINVLGAIRTIRSVLPLLKQSEQAAIVLFSTVAVQQGMPFHASVATAKGAIEGLTRSLAAEFAPKIRVNTIAPSLTNTPLASKLLDSDDKKKASDERHPLKRVGEADDIARMAGFLHSAEAAWVTGQIFHVDGGLSALRM
jgi:3-oxoacyl-[acyl-carrier protein] reductase